MNKVHIKEATYVQGRVQVTVRAWEDSMTMAEMTSLIESLNGEAEPQPVTSTLSSLADENAAIMTRCAILEESLKQKSRWADALIAHKNILKASLETAEQERDAPPTDTGRIASLEKENTALNQRCIQMKEAFDAKHRYAVSLIEQRKNAKILLKTEHDKVSTLNRILHAASREMRRQRDSAKARAVLAKRMHDDSERVMDTINASCILLDRLADDAEKLHEEDES